MTTFAFRSPAKDIDPPCNAIKTLFALRATHSLPSNDLIGGRMGYCGGDQHRGNIDPGLRFVGLFKAATGDRHGARLRAGEIDLIHSWDQLAGRLAAGFPYACLIFGGASGHLLVAISPLMRIVYCAFHSGGNPSTSTAYRLD
jgi:hypothetical protein